jgi:hypothetical protein
MLLNTQIYFISYTSNIDIAYGYGVIRQNIYRTQLVFNKHHVFRTG